MPKTIGRMTDAELRELIADTVQTALDAKLTELLGDPDDGLELRKELRARLVRQRKAVLAGERGRTLSQVAKELDLE